MGKAHATLEVSCHVTDHLCLIQAHESPDLLSPSSRPSSQIPLGDTRPPGLSRDAAAGRRAAEASMTDSIRACVSECRLETPRARRTIYSLSPFHQSSVSVARGACIGRPPPLASCRASRPLTQLSRDAWASRVSRGHRVGSAPLTPAGLGRSPALPLSDRQQSS